MTAPHRRRVGRSFGRAAGYDEHAHVQRKVAGQLADRIAALPLPARPRILEIGCGTGFLTRAMAERGLAGDWLITDIAAEMVARCRANVGDGDGRRFAVMDGQRLAAQGEYDLVCSSLAMQWFDDHAAALDRMLASLAPGGHCVLTTLSAGTFREWRAAHREVGLTAGTLPFLPAATIATLRPDMAERTLVERVVEHHGSALDFLRALRAIGAATAARDHRPLPPAALRRVMAAFEGEGSAVTYEIVTCHYRRPA